MTSLIDTHCHLDLIGLPMDQVLKEAKEAGVERVITIAVDMASLTQVKQLIRDWPKVYGTAGVHPHSAAEFDTKTVEHIRQDVLAEMKMLAIGEIGLDYHYQYSSKEAQQHAFREQLALAEEMNLPVVLHTREAEVDTLGLLRDHPPSRKGVAHSFTGTRQMAEELLSMGWYLGFNGIVTFKNAEELRQVVRNVPVHRLLLETDAPYLSPAPFRGKPNAPCRVSVIADYIAGLLEIPVEQLARQTTQNAKKLFSLS